MEKFFPYSSKGWMIYIYSHESCILVSCTVFVVLEGGRRAARINFACQDILKWSLIAPLFLSSVWCWCYFSSLNELRDISCEIEMNSNWQVSNVVCMYMCVFVYEELRFLVLTVGSKKEFLIWQMCDGYDAICCCQQKKQIMFLSTVRYLLGIPE